MHTLQIQILLPIVAISLASNGWAAPPARLVGDARRATEQLDVAAEFERRGQHNQAFEVYLKLIEQVGDEWETLADETSIVPVRRLVLNRMIANPKLKSLFRELMDQKAEELFQRGKSQLNLTVLATVIDEFLPTAAAERALDILGDLAFESGDFPLARHWWAMLKNRVPTATTEAKIILATFRSGESTDLLLKEFRHSHSEAVGHLAGQSGKLLEVLNRTCATESPKRSIREASSARGYWDRFPRRIARPDRGIALAPTSGRFTQTPNVSTRQLDLQPLIWRGLVLINDGDQITAIDLNTMRRVDAFGVERNTNGAFKSSPLQVHGDSVIGRISAGPDGESSQIVCLEADPDRETIRWRLRWQLDSASLPGIGDAAFEGTPVVRDNTMYMSWTRTSGATSTVWLAAFNANRPDHGPLWSRAILQLESRAVVESPRRQRLILAGPNVVYASDAGVIMAHDANSGRPVWGRRYTQRANRAPAWEIPPPKRLMAEHAAAAGRVFVAPADCDELLAFDIWTGESAWPRMLRLDVVHLLGVVHGKLIFTSEGMIQGVGAIDVTTGTIDSTWPTLNGIAPFGRGWVSETGILIPTRNDGLKLVRFNGQVAYPPTVWQSLPGGNLALGDNHLVIAGSHTLNVLKFWPEESTTSRTTIP